VEQGWRADGHGGHLGSAGRDRGVALRGHPGGARVQRLPAAPEAGGRAVERAFARDRGRDARQARRGGIAMASVQTGSDEEGINGINVTPLVDVTLVLLIVFMVTASYIVKETIEIELPRAAHGGETVQKTFALLVTKDGKTFLNGAPVDEAGLVSAVQAAKA